MPSIAAKVKVDIVRAMVVELGGPKLIYITFFFFFFFCGVLLSVEALPCNRCNCM